MVLYRLKSNSKRNNERKKQRAKREKKRLKTLGKQEVISNKEEQVYVSLEKITDLKRSKKFPLPPREDLLLEMFVFVFD